MLSDDSSKVDGFSYRLFGWGSFWLSVICDCKIGSGLILELIWITTRGKRQELIGMESQGGLLVSSSE